MILHSKLTGSTLFEKCQLRVLINLNCTSSIKDFGAVVAERAFHLPLCHPCATSPVKLLMVLWRLCQFILKKEVETTTTHTLPKELNENSSTQN
ncbi:hypothetical protein D3C74_98220 [compost metagenome]